MREQFTDALGEVDVLLTPTMPIKAVKLGGPGASLRADAADRALSAIQNTLPMNVTGLPALTVPCGRGEHNLPIGLQIVGRPFAESTLFGVGREYERSGRTVASPS